MQERRPLLEVRIRSPTGTSHGEPGEPAKNNKTGKENRRALAAALPLQLYSDGFLRASSK